MWFAESEWCGAWTFCSLERRLIVGGEAAVALRAEEGQGRCVLLVAGRVMDREEYGGLGKDSWTQATTHTERPGGWDQRVTNGCVDGVWSSTVEAPQRPWRNPSGASVRKTEHHGKRG